MTQLSSMHRPNANQNVRKTLALWREIHKTMEQNNPSPLISLNLSRGQLRVLILLYSSPQMSPGSVAAALGVPKANVTSIIERLVRQGFVTREPDRLDRRRHTLRLTEKGRSEFEQLREWNLDRTLDVFDRIPAEELATLARGLEIMLAAAQQAHDSNEQGGASGIAQTAIHPRPKPSRRRSGVV